MMLCPLLLLQGRLRTTVSSQLQRRRHTKRHPSSSVVAALPLPATALPVGDQGSFVVPMEGKQLKWLPRPLTSDVPGHELIELGDSWTPSESY